MILPADFDEYAIRRLYDEDTETWWFSVVDIVQVLTQQPDDTTARKYWNKLKERLNREGSQLVTNCHQLKMTARYGKQHVARMKRSVIRFVRECITGSGLRFDSYELQGGCMSRSASLTYLPNITK